MTDRPISSAHLLSFAAHVAHTIGMGGGGFAVAEEVRSRLRDALRDDQFVLDCVDAATSAMVPSLSAYDNPPIVVDDALDFSIRLIPWPARSRNRPHRHTFWTVTGVVWNELRFLTYAEPDSTDGSLDVEREFCGRRGDVGFIQPPCVHQIVNQTASPSISVHIFSGPKTISGDARKRYERGHTIWFGEDGGADAPPSGGASGMVAALIALLDTIADARAVPLLERLLKVGDLPSRLECTKAISKRDSVLAGRHLYEVAAECDGADRVSLRALAAALVGDLPV
jgi:predicted metal-dependent enzyme (double-stranded beta helix superfamily)